MPPVKPLSSISTKWARVAGQSQDSYTEGIQNPRADWKTQTAAANENYKKAMAQSINQDRFAKGVNAAGSDKWQRNALEKGPDRWAQGIRLSQTAYEQGFDPYRRVIETTNLPKRGPKGDPANIKRVEVMAKALHDAKLNRTGS